MCNIDIQTASVRDYGFVDTCKVLDLLLGSLFRIVSAGIRNVSEIKMIRRVIEHELVK